MTDQLKRYIDLYIPTEICNLRCSYCYVTLRRKFGNKLAEIPYTKQKIKESFSIERLGGKCLINFCADGETLLSRDVIKIIEALLQEGHYLMIVTNGTVTSRIKEISKLNPEITERLFFKFSFHYIQLIRQKKIHVFFGNVKTVKNAGCSYTVELVPHDELVPYIEDIKKICLKELGALCHVTIARDVRTRNLKILTKFSLEEYKKIWGVFDSDLFDFKIKIFNQKRKEFCYAGDWSLCINACTGEIHQCYGTMAMGNIYDINQPINFKPLGYNCTQPHCYNGHAFLSLGTIPSLDTPNFIVMRDRKTVFGTRWISNKFRNFIDQKLKNNNAEYSEEKRLKLLRNKKKFAIKNYKSRIVDKFRKMIYNLK